MPVNLNDTVSHHNLLSEAVILFCFVCVYQRSMRNLVHFHIADVIAIVRLTVCNRNYLHYSEQLDNSMRKIKKKKKKRILYDDVCRYDVSVTL